MNESLADQGRRIADAERRHVLVRVNQFIRRGELEAAARLADRAGLLAVAERVRRFQRKRTH